MINEHFEPTFNAKMAAPRFLAGVGIENPLIEPELTGLGAGGSSPLPAASATSG